MNKQGFTLIELLAVIIIIGVIAVITIPKVSDSLESSRKNIAQTSAYGYKNAIEEYILNQKINENKINLQGTYNINSSDGNLYNEENEYTISYKGKSPKNGMLVYNNNELVSGCITIDKYKATIANGEVTNVEKGTCQYTRILTRIEKLPQQLASYITAVEGLNKTESGIYGVSELNSQIVYQGEKPTDGWVSLVYDETNGNWVWKYSIKYRENEVVSYNGTTQTSSAILETQPIIVLIAGTNGKTAGDEIAIGTEHFYILENTGTKIITLAKANLNVGNNKNTNLPEGIQGEAGTNYAVKFAQINYWVDENNLPSHVKSEYLITNYIGYIYDPENYSGEPNTNTYSIAYYVVGYINQLNSEYPSLNISGRLLTNDEYGTYKVNYQSRLESQKFWLGTGRAGVSSSTSELYGSIYTTYGGTVSNNNAIYTTSPGVRPVIEIDVSKI